MKPSNTVRIVLSLLFLAAPTAAQLSIDSLPGDPPTGFDQVFTKYVDVLGVGLYATATTPNSKVLHGAAILAQWLDNDEDGVADDSLAHFALTDAGASMLMWASEEEFESSIFHSVVPDSVLDSIPLQPLFGTETNPGYPGNGEFDFALEECLHLVTFGGYAIAYPAVFGEFAGSEIADAMDTNIANGFFHYDDPTCDYPCLISEYTYWGLTSILGAQDYAWRIGEIIGEWELYTEQLVSTNDPLLHAILTDPQWSLATTLPDGSYLPSTVDTIFEDGFDSGDTSSWID